MAEKNQPLEYKSVSSVEVKYPFIRDMFSGAKSVDGISTPRSRS